MGRPIFCLLLLQLFYREHILNAVEFLDDVLVHLLLVRAQGDNSAIAVLVVLAGDAVYLNPAELYALVAYGTQDILNDLRVGVFNVEIHVIYLPCEAVLYLYQQQLRHQHHRRREYRALDVARAADKADYRGRPEPGGSRQTLGAL